MEKNMLAIAIKPTQKMLETKDNGRKGGKGTFPVYRYILFMHIKKNIAILLQATMQLSLAVI